MPLRAGTHQLGPHNATLSVHTKRKGAAAKAGHDLVIHVTSWEGSLELGEDPESTSVELTADGASLRVQEGTGGLKALGDDDKASIHQTIDDEVLKRQDIAFRSTSAQPAADGGRIRVEGDLTLVGTTRPIAFELVVGDDEALSATAVVTQSNWGVKPYTGLFGALKVLDEVEVVLDGQLKPQSR
jgi:polyisoprenoid-binding protein YceI